MHNSDSESHNGRMTEKEIVLETIRALPDNCSSDEIAERSEFRAAVQINEQTHSLPRCGTDSMSHD